MLVQGLLLCCRCSSLCTGACCGRLCAGALNWRSPGTTYFSSHDNGIDKETKVIGESVRSHESMSAISPVDNITSHRCLVSRRNAGAALAKERSNSKRESDTSDDEMEVCTSKLKYDISDRGSSAKHSNNQSDKATTVPKPVSGQKKRSNGAQDNSTSTDNDSSRAQNSAQHNTQHNSDNAQNNSNGAQYKSNSARYDRQIRIWGDHGQAALQRASVLLLGSSAVAGEVLRNLMLLGIEHFLIIDDAVVCPSDIGNSWLAATDIGLSRARCVAREALSLNPEARGAYLCVAAETYIDFCCRAVTTAAAYAERDAHIHHIQQQLFHQRFYVKSVSASNAVDLVDSADADAAASEEKRLTELTLNTNTCVPFPLAFSVVIATQLPLHTMLSLSRLCGYDRTDAPASQKYKSNGSNHTMDSSNGNGSNCSGSNGSNGSSSNGNSSNQSRRQSSSNSNSSSNSDSGDHRSSNVNSSRNTSGTGASDNRSRSSSRRGMPCHRTIQESLSETCAEGTAFYESVSSSRAVGEKATAAAGRVANNMTAQSTRNCGNRRGIPLSRELPKEPLLYEEQQHEGEEENEPEEEEEMVSSCLSHVKEDDDRSAAAVAAASSSAARRGPGCTIETEQPFLQDHTWPSLPCRSSCYCCCCARSPCCSCFCFRSTSCATGKCLSSLPSVQPPLPRVSSSSASSSSSSLSPSSSFSFSASSGSMPLCHCFSAHTPASSFHHSGIHASCSSPWCSSSTCVPLLTVTCVGLLGVVRVCAGEFCIIDRKAAAGDASIDLRLYDPFPELLEYAQSIDVDSLDDIAHAQVPYVVLLIQAAERWRQQGKRGRRSSTAAQLTAFSEEEGVEKAEAETREMLLEETGARQGILNILESMRRHPEEINFDEAAANVHRVLRPHSPSEEAIQVLKQASETDSDDRSCCSSRRENAGFWLLARALHGFQRTSNKLPLQGIVPDMTCDSNSFLRLQQLYGKRAEGDCNAIKASVAMQTQPAQGAFAAAAAAAIGCAQACSSRLGTNWCRSRTPGSNAAATSTKECSSDTLISAGHSDNHTAPQEANSITRRQQDSDRSARGNSGGEKMTNEDVFLYDAADESKVHISWEERHVKPPCVNRALYKEGGHAPSLVSGLMPADFSEGRLRKTCICCTPVAEDIEIFTKNAHELKVIRYRTLAEEYETSSIHRTTYERAAAALQAYAKGCVDEGVPLLPWYLCLWAAHRFAARHGYFPGASFGVRPWAEVAAGHASGSSPNEYSGRITPGLNASTFDSWGTRAINDVTRRPEVHRCAGQEVAQADSAAAGYSPITDREKHRGDVSGYDLSDKMGAALNSDEFGLWREVSRLLSEVQCAGLEVSSQIIEQFVAFGGAELHSCAALVGGAAAQEAVKLICKQFDPVNNTFIWCGVERMAQVLEL